MKIITLLLFAFSIAHAQQRASTQPLRVSSWFNSQTVDFAALAPAPPSPGSAMDKQDMENVLLAQRTRTAAQVQQAQQDDKEEDIFIFSSILGPAFNATELPLTATLSRHLRDASSVINPQLKVRFGRPRPFVASAQVHPVCQQTASNSFPSGHGMVGTLEALALTQIVPERSTLVLDRLREYLRNRVVCGVHYPTDVAASQIVASTLFGLIAASPAFQDELALAKQEVRSHLELPGTAAESATENNYLANNTVLIVRHAEKPNDSTGQPGLTELGQHRAEAYVRYFQPFQENGLVLHVSALFAGADSASSTRPRLTLEPLSKASGMPLNTTIGTKDPELLLQFLRTHPHGSTPLIAWRHGQIPALLAAFGVAPGSLLPGAKWPDDVYDWVLVLHFDAKGIVTTGTLVKETFQVK